MSANIDPAAQIYDVAQKDMKVELEKMQQDLAAAREESFALGILKKIAYDNAHNQFLEYAVLDHVKQLKLYKKGGMTWKQFCEAIGKPVRRVDEVLGDIRPLIEKFSAEFADLSGIKFSKIRYLGRSISGDCAEITEKGLVVGEDEVIPIDPDHKEDIEAYIDSLKQSETAARKEIEAQKEAHERVTKHLHATINTLEKDITAFKKKDPDGVTGAEKEQLKGIAGLKAQFDLFARAMAPEVNGYLKGASAAVKSEYGSVIAYGSKVLELLRDRAFDELDISIYPAGDLGGQWQQPEWVPPEELIDDEPGE